MIEQRHPSLRVTPVEVGEPIRWTAPSDDLAAAVTGTTEARGRHYCVAPVDDVWEASYTTMVLGHGGQRPHRVHVRYCVDRVSAMMACQDAEHVRAWELLPSPARDLLLGLHGPVAA